MQNELTQNNPKREQIESILQKITETDMQLQQEMLKSLQMMLRLRLEVIKAAEVTMNSEIDWLVSSNDLVNEKWIEAAERKITNLTQKMNKLMAMGMAVRRRWINLLARLVELGRRDWPRKMQNRLRREKETDEVND